MPRSIHSFARVTAQVFLALAVSLALFLIAPTKGIAWAQEPPLDHFRCYPLVLGPQSEVAQAALQDQFDVFLGLDLPDDQALLRFFIGQPDRFCNPVEKTVRRGGTVVTTPISDPNAHLTLYDIFQETVSAPAFLGVPAVSWRVRVRNQFGEQRLRATRPVALAVPTQKHEDDLEFPDDLDHFKCYEARGSSIRRQALLADQFEEQRVAVLEPRLFCNPTRKLLSTGLGAAIEHPTDHLVCYDLNIVTDAFDIVVQLLPRVISNQFTGSSTGDIAAVTSEDLLCVPSSKLSFSPERGDDDDDDDGDDDHRGDDD